jgi:hypothetical protein
MLGKYTVKNPYIYEKWLKKVGGGGLKVAFFLSEDVPGGEIQHHSPKYVTFFLKSMTLAY